MKKQKLDKFRCVEQNRMRGQEIVEYGEQKIGEAHRNNSPSLSPFDFEVVDIDDIVALMECGKEYSVEELVSQFGISVDVAKSLLVPRSCIETPISNLIAEVDTSKETYSEFSDTVLSMSADSFDVDLPLNALAEFTDEELVQIADELEHAF